jgi:hypothetical protein
MFFIIGIEVTVPDPLEKDDIMMPQRAVVDDLSAHILVDGVAPHDELHRHILVRQLHCQRVTSGENC